ncbi:hypothetical protein Tco_0946765 [Tanacetum coccineum]
MGELTFFLGLQVKQQSDGIFISQDKYVADILKKFDFLSIRTATTPIESNKPLVKDEDGVDVDVHVYRSMIGSLMYLTVSRPDIMFAVCACARFQVTPKASHLNAVKRIFRISMDWRMDRKLLKLANSTHIWHKHNMVAFLKKPNESVGFTEVVDFLKGDFVPLLPAMLAGAAMDQGEGSAQPAEPHPTPIDPLPSTSLPPNQSPY